DALVFLYDQRSSESQSAVSCCTLFAYYLPKSYCSHESAVVDIMRTNVEKVLERDQKLSQLDDRAASRTPKQRKSVHQLRQVSVAQDYQPELARRLLGPHSHADDEDCLEIEWKWIKEAMLSAFRTTCPKRLQVSVGGSAKNSARQRTHEIVVLSDGLNTYKRFSWLSSTQPLVELNELGWNMDTSNQQRKSNACRSGDDIALIFEDQSEAQALLNRLITIIPHFGMRLAPSKNTVVLQNVQSPNISLTIQRESLEIMGKMLGAPLAEQFYQPEIGTRSRKTLKFEACILPGREYNVTRRTVKLQHSCWHHSRANVAELTYDCATHGCMPVGVLSECSALDRSTIVVFRKFFIQKPSRDRRRSLGNLTVSQPSCFLRVASQLGTGKVLQLNEDQLMIILGIVVFIILVVIIVMPEYPERSRGLLLTVPGRSDLKRNPLWINRLALEMKIMHCSFTVTEGIPHILDWSIESGVYDCLKLPKPITCGSMDEIISWSIHYIAFTVLVYTIDGRHHYHER
ncbi:hypothetical protein CLF_100517, partial [Clonorchis sinensis]